MQDYHKIATDCRKKVLELIYKAQTSHIGSNFSCTDIMTVLFEKIDLEKDKFVLSKGWAAATLYYFLWKRGKITTEQLNSYCQEGSDFIGLAEPIIPEIIIAGGSMGMGLPGAVGLALAKKIKGEDGKVYCLMSDGELQIGTTWEASLIASHHQLDNLVVVVDYNGLQAMGSTEDVLSLGNIHQKMRELGFDSFRIDGHDYDDLELMIRIQPVKKPLMIIADTIKGKGVSFMEGANIYHYKQLSEDEFNKASKELWEK